MLPDRFLKDIVTTSNKFHDGVYKIYYKTHNEEGHKEVKICIDNVTCSAMKLTVADDRDPRFMFSLELTRDDYSVLQTQQSLLIPFEAFPKQVVRLLEESARGDMLLQLLQTAQCEWCLQFVVRNEFKSLTHLQLLIGRASDSDLIHFMSNKMQALTDSLNKAHQTLLTKEDTYRRAIDQRDADLQSLKKNLESTKMEIKRAESEHKRELAASIEHITKERDMWQREHDNRYETKLSDLQSEIQRKKTDIDRAKSELSMKSEKLYSLDNSIREHSSKIKSLEQDLNSSRSEQNTLQNDLSRAQRELNDKDGQIQNLRTRITDLERRLVIKDEQLSKANSSLTLCQQNIAEAESKVTDCMIKLNNKRETLQVTSQDLAKANEIISKQNEQINGLKEKVKFRTAVAFEQEKIIEKLQSELGIIKIENGDVKIRLEESQLKTMELSKEIQELNNKLTDKDKTIEYNSTMINWMQKRINETSGLENSTGILNIGSGVSNMTLRNNYNNTMMPTFPHRAPSSLPVRHIGQIVQKDTTGIRNIGELSPDLLLPNDSADTARPIPPRTLSQISNNVPRCNIGTGASRLNSGTDRSSKSGASVAANNIKIKVNKTQRRNPPAKAQATPSNYFTNVT